MLAFRSVVSVLLRSWETFLYTLKAGPAGGLRPPSGPAATRRPPGHRPHRRNRTAAALTLESTLVNHNAKASDPRK
jgi:hypothetical protein